MNKTEYVDIIEKSLVGKVDAQELRDTVEYYRDYIDMEIRKGKTEAEVLEHLGNPRLLAKSIVEARKQKTPGESGYTQEAFRESEENRISGFRVPFPILILIILLFLGMIISAVLSVAGFLMPVLLPVLIVFGVITLVKRWKR